MRAVDLRAQSLHLDHAELQLALQRHQRHHRHVDLLHLQQRLAGVPQAQLAQADLPRDQRPGRAAQRPLQVQRGVELAGVQAHRQVGWLQLAPVAQRQSLQLQVADQRGVRAVQGAAHAQLQRGTVEPAVGLRVQRAVGTSQRAQVGQAQIQVFERSVHSAGLVVVQHGPVVELEQVHPELRRACRRVRRRAAAQAPQHVLEGQAPVASAHHVQPQTLQAQRADPRVQAPQAAPVEAHDPLAQVQLGRAPGRVQHLQVVDLQSQAQGIEGQRADAHEAPELLPALQGDLAAQPPRDRPRRRGNEQQQKHGQRREQA